ncbi:MAG: ATP-binding protein [Candidatus Omnitrophica bacterium]|nr:ATP-binding protein [Candidatus Omnitrophota bacterium]
MIIEFSVGNFLSFKDIVTFSMVASAKKEHADTNLFIANNKLRLLKSAVIYGANASGKSNLIRAMRFMKKFVLTSTQDKGRINVTNFKLSAETDDKPSLFEVVFIHKETRYRYGFQVDREKVVREWLFSVPIRKETQLFVREGDNFQIGTHFKEGKGKEKITRPNALFLSVVAQWNGEISKEILNWFGKNLHIISTLIDVRLVPFTLERIKDEEFRKNVLRFLKEADLGIEDINLEETQLKYEDMSEKEKAKFGPEGQVFNVSIQTLHSKFDNENKPISSVKFDLGIEESEGTKKFFALSGPFLDTLKNGSIIVVDELDAKLHPILIKFLITLFNSLENNPKNAQLVFASHNTNLFNRSIFRRDQIWLTEKNKYGATDLYSLAEYKVRNDASFEKDYIAGKYGAIPFIRGDNSLFRK